MLEFHKFKKKYLESMYSLKGIDEETITLDYNLFLEGITDAEDMALSLLKNSGFDVSRDMMIEGIESNTYVGNHYEETLLDSVLVFLEDVYGNERIDGSGTCLKSKLIGRACQMIYNEEMLGVVRDYDKDKPNLLYVDFGDEENIKIDIDELIIAGQKNVK
jgi:hypothetical protein